MCLTEYWVVRVLGSDYPTFAASNVLCVKPANTVGLPIGKIACKDLVDAHQTFKANRTASRRLLITIVQAESSFA